MRKKASPAWLVLIFSFLFASGNASAGIYLLFSSFFSKPTPPPPATQSAVFNGTTSLFQSGSGSDLSYEYTQPLTFCGWVKQSSSATTAGVMVAKLSTGASNLPFTGYTFQYNSPPNNSFALSLGLSPSVREAISSTSATFLQDVWFLACGSEDGSGHTAGMAVTICQSGTCLVQPTGMNVDTLGGNSILNGTDFTVGGNPLGSSSEGDIVITGGMTQITVWTTSLSFAQIQFLYNGGTPIDPRTSSAVGSLVAWFPMDSTYMARDLIGSVSLTNIGGVVFTGDYP
jgi:hypothetical protein